MTNAIFTQFKLLLALLAKCLKRLDSIVVQKNNT